MEYEHLQPEEGESWGSLFPAGEVVPPPEKLHRLDNIQAKNRNCFAYRMDVF